MTEKNLLPGIACAFVLLASPASAVSANVTVVDKSGRPLAEAVVELSSDMRPLAAAEIKPPSEAIIDQRHETFLPLVTVIRKGGRVIFTNNDTTMHQVYSFSPIRQFAFEIDEGQRSTPVVFDKAGVAAIGCNIHDRMITYVYVADTPFAAKTDSRGVASFDELPAGNYRGTAWHPQLGTALRTFAFATAENGAKTTVALPVNGAIASAKKAMHMQMY